MSDFFDFQALVPTLGAQTSAPRLRLAVVQSVESNRTCTVKVGGSTVAISGVKYLGNAQPLPNATAWIVSDGTDLFLLGTLAGNDRTFSPRISRSTDQSIGDATDTAIQFDAANSDAWGAWSAGDPNRVYARLTGRYIAVGQVQFAPNGTGYRAAWIEKTGTSTVARVNAAAAASAFATYITVSSAPFDMTAGTDYVRLLVRQNSGGALLCTNNSTFFPSLSLVYLGP